MSVTKTKYRGNLDCDETTQTANGVQNSRLQTDVLIETASFVTVLLPN